MSSKPSKWLFDITGGDTNGIRESTFPSLNLFPLTIKNIFLALLRGAIASIAPMHPLLFQWDCSHRSSPRNAVQFSVANEA